MEKIKYFDIPKNFTMKDSDISVYDEDRAIIENVKNIVSFTKNTILMNNRLGTNIKSLFFSPMVPIVAYIICDNIKEEILRNEFRISGCEVYADFKEDENINIRIKLYSKGKELETSERYYLG